MKTRSPRWWTPLTGSIITVSLALIALGSWSVASPIGSSPDDDYHLASIWCGLGEREGICEAGETPDERLVPPRAALSSACVAFEPEKSADCEFAADSELVPSVRGDFADNLYPPVFYATMSLFVGPDVAVSTIAMRLLNAGIFVALVAVTIALMPRERKRTVGLALVVTMVPLGMFIVPSVNPSSWAVTSAATLWLLLMAYFEAESPRRRLLLGGLAVLAAVIGAGARADAAVYNGVAVVAAMILTATRERITIRSLIVPVVIATLSLWSFFSSSQSRADLTGSLGELTFPGLVGLMSYNVPRLPELWAGVFGTWALGWFDVSLPGGVWVLTLTVVGAVLFAGLGIMSRRKGVAVAFLALCLVAIPLVILTRGQILVGAYVQPRYFLPLIIMIVGIATLSAVTKRLEFSTTQLMTMISLLSIANAIALAFTIRRYVTGTDVSSPNLDSGVEWWWSGPVSPMGVWAIGTIAFAATLVALFCLDRLHRASIVVEQSPPAAIA